MIFDHISLSYRGQYGKKANLKMCVSRKQSTPNFPKNEHFLPPDTHTCVGKKYLFFGKFGVLWDSPFCLITDDITLQIIFKYPLEIGIIVRQNLNPIWPFRKFDGKKIKRGLYYYYCCCCCCCYYYYYIIIIIINFKLTKLQKFLQK